VTSTEVAIIMPAIIVVILFVFQIALFWHAKQAADLAAEEAVEAAQISTASADDAYTGANAILGQAGNLRDAQVTVDRDLATGLVTVTVTGNAPAIIPFGGWNVHASAQAPIEQFISAGDR
jgi:Flp pilus assembly protein TadG